MDGIISGGHSGGERAGCWWVRPGARPPPMYNASIHTAKKVKEWFAERSITNITDWPPYSPDLSPIEHAWWELKKSVFEMFPEIATEKSQSEDVRQRLESVLQAAWDTIDKEFFDTLYQSMPD